MESIGGEKVMTGLTTDEENDLHQIEAMVGESYCLSNGQTPGFLSKPSSYCVFQKYRRAGTQFPFTNFIDQIR
jgi:hypothetical protein